MNEVRLVILTPAGEAASVECDHVNLFARDNAAGENGGSVGIRRGHAPAVVALEANSVVAAKSCGREVFRTTVSGGFARVGSDRVTVITAAVN